MAGFSASSAKGKQSLDGETAGQFIDTSANWTSSNPILGPGQLGIESDTGKLKWGDGQTAWNDLPYRLDSPRDAIVVPVGDESTALTAGTDKVKFRMPFAATLVEVRANVNTAPTGSALVVDIHEAGTSVLGTKLSIDATQTTSTTATTAATITDTGLADDAEISIDIDQIGSTVAGAGLKVTLFVLRT